MSAAKEVVRMFSQLPNHAGKQDILALGAKKSLHRDVRAVIVGCVASQYLSGGEENVWEILESGARDPEVVVATSSVQLINLTKLSPLLQTRALERVVLPAASNHPEPLVRCAAIQVRGKRRRRRRRRIDFVLKFLQFCFKRLAFFKAENDPNGRIPPVLFKAFRDHTSNIFSFAISTFFTLYHDRIAEIELALSELDKSYALIDTFVNLLMQRAAQPSHLIVVEAVLSWMSNRPVLMLHRVRLCIAALIFDKRLESILLEASAGHIEGVFVACEAVRNVVVSDNVELSFRTHKNHFFRRIGLAMLVSQASKYGWADSKREALEQYCNDSSVMVQAPAKFVFPPLKG